MDKNLFSGMIRSVAFASISGGHHLEAPTGEPKSIACILKAFSETDKEGIVWFRADGYSVGIQKGPGGFYNIYINQREVK